MAYDTAVAELESAVATLTSVVGRWRLGWGWMKRRWINCFWRRAGCDFAEQPLVCGTKKKARIAAGLCCVWLPDLDSNQGHTD